MSTEPKAGEWVKALRPGTIKAAVGDKFVKAGEKFQLTKDIPFSDKWMEKTDAPEEVKPSEKDVKKEQAEAVAEHERTDAIRRGKFSIPAVPRSEEGRKAHEDAERKKLQAEREAQAKAAHASPPVGGVPAATLSQPDENATKR